jgi:V/A-type H+/Na+-transporting ATPase subunit I
MPLRESMEPVRMRRIAVLAPRERLRDVLVEIAAHGTAELASATETEAGPAARLLDQAGSTPSTPTLARAEPDLERLASAGRIDLIAGEAQLESRTAATVTRGSVAGLLGWAPEREVPVLAQAISPSGGAVVPLPVPRGIDPPSLVHSRSGLNKSLAPLVDTYTTVPYADVDPTVLAGLAFMVMFGMMFADAGQGALLLLGGLLLRAGRLHRLRGVRVAWPFIVGCGVAAIVFGVLFGEFFGPTEVLPTLWVKPLEQPILLLGVSIGVGACLLAGAYALGTINRWREGGWRAALLATSGVAGAVLFLGLGLICLGAYLGHGWLFALAVLVSAGGLTLAYLGLVRAAGGGATGAGQAGVELFDGVIRLGTNLVSFARLAAFGLAHAALLGMVWQATTGLWARGGWGWLAAVAVFLLGNLLTFVLEGVVAGVQALRLEYYELFSRVFVTEGRAFSPWSLPVSTERVS